MQFTFTKVDHDNYGDTHWRWLVESSDGLWGDYFHEKPSLAKVKAIYEEGL